MAKDFDINSRSPGGHFPAGNWIIVRIAAFILAFLIIVISVILVFHYTELENEREALEEKLKELEEKNRELTYYTTSPIDEYYVRKFAWEMYGLVPSDGKVYITDTDN